MHTLEELLADARSCYAAGNDEAAKAAYLKVLKLDPCESRALSELGALALATGHRSAARTAYQQAVQCHPIDPAALVDLGNLELQDINGTLARQHFEAALRLDAQFPEAHQGLARALTEAGEHAAAAAHFKQGFTGHALVSLPYRGQGAPVRVLLLVSTRYGNVSTREFLDNRLFEILVLYPEYFDATQALPPHDVVFNAIGDAELCAKALQSAQQVLQHSSAPLINAPGQVLKSSRLDNAQRLGKLAGVVAAETWRVGRGQLAAFAAQHAAEFPLLLRSPGFHMGSHFILVGDSQELLSSAAALPGKELLAMGFLDGRGADGMTRKYRVMIVDGELYPLHLAISAHWKVHYFSAAMASDPALREEERRFLDDMPAVLGKTAIEALRSIGAELGLDYAGVDFGLSAEGSVLLFEANATMVVAAPPPDPMWDYRRAAIARAREAAVALVRLRAAGTAAARKEFKSNIGRSG
jgi:glutathione synthase/RimK-type ligase-like ATP-grasp enzyme